MTQLEIAALAVGAFAIFMFGYSLGWLHRGQQQRSIRFRDDFVEVDGPVDEALLDRVRLEMAVRRSQR